MKRSNHQFIDAVIFDFGGVFTRSERILEELHGYERQLGLPRDAIVLALGSGEAWRAVSIGAISEEEYWAGVSPAFAPELPPAFGRFQHGALPFEELNQEVVALAESLRGTVRTGLLSNATISLAAYLDRLPAIHRLFDDIVISAEVGLRKPDPAIYQLAVNRLGVEASRAVLVDDKSRNTKAAQAVGMHAIVFSSQAQLRADLSRLGVGPDARS